MRQLVGSKCLICQERIDSVLEGRVCSSCESPVHDKCARAPVPASSDLRCAACGADLEQAKALAAAAAKQDKRLLQARPASPTGDYPISQVCPKCRHAAFKTIRAQKWVAFTNDRVCKECGTRYTPPTPRWGAVVLVIFGLGLSGFMAWSLMLRFATGQVLAIPAMACEGFLGFLGVMAIIQGARALSQKPHATGMDQPAADKLQSSDEAPR
jgi:uncharacterized protein (DUF983 family)